MNDDLLKRLVRWGADEGLQNHFIGSRSARKDCEEAAARIAELEAEVARLRVYGDPAFYVCAAARWEKATASAKRETEDWKRAAQTANKRAISDDATIRSLRKKLDAARPTTHGTGDGE